MLMAGVGRYCVLFSSILKPIFISLRHAKLSLRTTGAASIQPKIIFGYKPQYIFTEFGF